jgi:hypothetical protein
VLLFFYSYVDYVVNTETTIVLIDKHDGIDRISKYKIDGLSIQRVEGHFTPKIPYTSSKNPEKIQKKSMKSSKSVESIKIQKIL